MKKLNNKGITTIEVLICFVIVVIITVSMYTTVSAYNEKRILETNKEKVTNYKNLLTKEIQDDLVKIGLTGAKVDRVSQNSKVTYTVNMDLRDGSKRQLIVEQALAQSAYHPSGNPDIDDEFMILYGPPTALQQKPLPDLGSYKNEHDHMVKDLSINNVLINILDEKVLSIYIGFYHPELGTRYAINLTAPIDFVFTGAEFVDPRTVHYFIIYNLFGGTVANPNPVSYDMLTESFTLRNPTKTGSIFTGWTGSNGTERQTTVTIPKGSSGNRKYDANWRDNQCTITYDPNGGVFNNHATATSQKVAYGGRIDNLRDAVGTGGYYEATKPGYSAVANKEWIMGTKTFDQTGAYNVNQFCSDIASGDQSTTLKVNWQANNFTIAYNANGGTGTMANTSCTYDQDCMLRNNAFTRAGYTFDGWATSATGAKAYDNGANAKNGKGSGTLTLYARWIPNTFTIVYDKYYTYATTGTMDNTTCTYDQNCYLRANGFARRGYNFDGWSTTQGGARVYANGANAKNAATSGTITLYAVWIAQRTYEHRVTNQVSNLNRNWLVADSFTYNICYEGNYYLNNPTVIGDRDLSSVKGKYTLRNTMNTCRTDYILVSLDVEYIADTTDNRFLYLLNLTNGQSLDSVNSYYVYGDSYRKNANGTYTVLNPISFRRTTYIPQYANLTGKYLCFNPSNNTCSDLWYVTNASRSIITYSKVAENEG